MATRQVPGGIAHLTVVPENFDPESDRSDREPDGDEERTDAERTAA